MVKQSWLGRERIGGLLLVSLVFWEACRNNNNLLDRKVLPWP